MMHDITQMADTFVIVVPISSLLQKWDNFETF